MSFWKGVQDKAVWSRVEEEEIHAAALEEFESSARRKGLWAKALIEAEGDPARTEAIYLRLLVGALKDQLYMASRVQEALGVHFEQSVIESGANSSRGVSGSVQRSAQEVLRNQAEYYACETLIRHAGGRVEARGIIFGIHYLVTIQNHTYRLDRMSDLVAWVKKNLPLSEWASGQC
jgi:hypothetical protein